MIIDCNFVFRNCVQFCDEPGANCREGALLTQTVSYIVLTLDRNEIQPYQDLMQLTVFGEDGRQLPRTRYRIVENETGLFVCIFVSFFLFYRINL
jgi:hypothetical protein